MFFSRCIFLTFQHVVSGGCPRPQVCSGLARPTKLLCLCPILLRIGRLIVWSPSTSQSSLARLLGGCVHKPSSCGDEGDAAWPLSTAQAHRCLGGTHICAPTHPCRIPVCMDLALVSSARCPQTITAYFLFSTFSSVVLTLKISKMWAKKVLIMLSSQLVHSSMSTISNIL